MLRREGREGLPYGGLLSVGLLVAVLLSPGAASSPGEDTVVRWYDVRSLHAAGVTDPSGVDLRLPLVSSYLDRLEPDGYDVFLEDHLDGGANGWLEAVFDGLDERWPGGDVELESKAGFLRVEASPVAQEEVAAVLADLRRHVARTVEVELFILPSVVLQGATSPVLSAKDAAELIAAAEQLEYSRKSTRLGQRVRLGGEGLSASLIDYDVEVATKARVADPQVTVLRAGAEVGVVVRESYAGGYRVRAWGRRAVPEDPPRRLSLDHLGGAPLELPVSESNLCVGSASVESGGGFLLGQNHGPEGVWLIRVSEKGATPQMRTGGSRFLPLGDLTSVPLLVDPPELSRTQPSGGFFIEEDSLVQQLGDAAYERLFEPVELLDRIRWQSDDLGLQGNVALVGHHLYLRGSPAFLEWADAKIGELHGVLASQTVEVEVRLGMLERSAAARLVLEASPEQLIAELPNRLVGACRLGDSLLLVGGTERFYLVDHDVEIAEAAAIPDPIIFDLFEGVSFWCCPNRAGSGALSAWIDLQVHEAAREIREIPVSTWEPRVVEQKDDSPMPTGTYTLNAKIELPATARAELTSNVRLPEGAWTLLCSTPLAGSDRQLVAMARVRVLAK